MEDNSLGPIKLHKYEGDVMLEYLSVSRCRWSCYHILKGAKQWDGACVTMKRK